LSNPFNAFSIPQLIAYTMKEHGETVVRQMMERGTADKEQLLDYAVELENIGLDSLAALCLEYAENAVSAFDETTHPYKADDTISIADFQNRQRRKRKAWEAKRLGAVCDGPAPSGIDEMAKEGTESQGKSLAS
jgi:hypothetical protein